VPTATTQEQQALQVSLRDWAKRAGTIATQILLNQIAERVLGLPR
jgi:hypothetical protein